MPIKTMANNHSKRICDFILELYHISVDSMLNTSNYYHLIVALMIAFHNKSLFSSLGFLMYLFIYPHLLAIKYSEFDILSKIYYHCLSGTTDWSHKYSLLVDR